jgi:glutathione S-transferase
MSNITLIIGNKNYSSWSLRPWLLLKQAGIAFTEIRIPLHTPGTRAEILKHSPAGKVPVLHDGDITLWESLAICEYLAEKHPRLDLWPTDAAARAHARVIASEMHAGFAPLRQHMNMNCRKRLPGRGRTPEVLKDIERICAMWNDSRARFGDGGDFLFGRFSIADAMFAPVVLRFVTYAVDLDPVSAAYVQAIVALPAMQQWLAEAAAETEVIAQYEHGT